MAPTHLSVAVVVHATMSLVQFQATVLTALSHRLRGSDCVNDKTQDYNYILFCMTTVHKEMRTHM